jgi:hypothetical protein
MGIVLFKNKEFSVSNFKKTVSPMYSIMEAMAGE